MPAGPGRGGRRARARISFTAVNASRPLIALACGLAAAEIALRIAIGGDGLLFGHPLPPYGEPTPAQRAWLAGQREASRPGAVETGPGRFDAELGWTVRPNGRSDDGLATSNAIGARGPREYASPKPPGVVRIACFGDSYTWCDEVADADAWPHRLEELDARIEAPNFGVAAYGTDQALLRFRREGRALEADVVAIGFLLENVGRNVNRYRPCWYPDSGSLAAKPRFVLEERGLRLVPTGFATQAELVAAIEDGSIRGRLAPDDHWASSLGPLASSAVARVAGAILADRAREVDALLAAPEGVPYRTTLALLVAFHEEARAAGAAAAPVLLFPRRVDLEDHLAGGERFWARLESDLRARGVPVIDLAAPLADAARVGGVGALYRGGHLSREGNAVVARALLAWLGSAQSL